MSSLSFDRVFPSETRDQNGQKKAETNAGTKAAPDQRNGQPPRATPSRVLTFTEASPWVRSGSRRCIEMAVAFVALVMLAPLMLVAAMLVRFSSRGPIFFRQRRMGRNGREFTLYKFRSMMPAGVRGASITVAGDKRITPAGVFLRRYKLDEIPQFFNVLRGDMALVGPRPKLPHHEALHLDCRPGITGVATLAFHREEEFLAGIPAHELDGFYETFVKPAKAAMDRQYMRTATLASDLKVLARTAGTCLLGADDSLVNPAGIISQHAAHAIASARRAPAATPHPVVRDTPVAMTCPVVREAPVRAVSLSREL
jgi:lipopolysaccharide/colanic/teichoic acid biosynthesis glycosyltransferase